MKENGNEVPAGGKSVYRPNLLRTFSELKTYMESLEHPVLLLEGIRALPDAKRPVVREMGRWLAASLPGVVFRTGNAEGSDEAFAEGVASVDASRLQYVLPNPRMGQKRLDVRGKSVSLSDVSGTLRDRLGAYTVEASPKSKGLVDSFLGSHEGTRLSAQASYLVRDTLKVLGAPEAGLSPADAGLFFANALDHFAGGTGHTIRACLLAHIPVILQKTWLRWMEQSETTQGENNHGT